MNDIFIILTTLIFTAFFSGIEIAFLSANKLKIELDKNRGKVSGKILSRFFQKPSIFISSILLGNNIALVIYGISTAKILEPLLRNLFKDLNSEFILLLLQTVIATLVILVTAEFLPKSLFRINPNRVLSFFSIPLFIIYYLSFPIVYLFFGFSETFLKYFLKIQFTREKYSFSHIDLDYFVREFSFNQEEKHELETEIQMFQNAMDFRSVKLRECMVPRTEIDAIEINSSIETLTEKFIQTGHSKILLYQGSLENIIGYAHSSDLFSNPKSIQSIKKPLLFFPETMLANKLMATFIKEHISIAVVVDEFGGISGMLTLEDVMEEIVGEIEDEYDIEELTEKQISETEFEFSGRHEIDYVNGKYKLNLPASDDYETIAGLIIYNHESIPEQNETIHIENFIFTILIASENRIEKIKLKITDK